MARTVKDVRLDNRAARQRLEPKKKPYFRVLETGRHIGYYKGQNGGSWVGRTYDGKKYRESTLGAADDLRDANGLDVLSFSQAQAVARAWFDQLARAERGLPAGPYLVSQACNAYLAEYRAGRAKDEVNTIGRLNHVKAALGSVEVAKLTTARIKAWHREIATTGRLTRAATVDETGERRRLPFDPADKEALRRRQATANRTLTVLKAALNHAFRNQSDLGAVIPSRTAWEAAAPFKEVDAPKVRFLTDAEAVRLLNAAQGAFRDLVAAALLTGCRYGELCRLKVRDFDMAAASLRIEVSKFGGSRSIALTDEGVSLFARLATGNGGGELLLVPDTAAEWKPSDQLRRIAAACEAAKITPAISFHILRHTYGSRLAMNGVPLPVIARQLGHAGTRMTERHYAHLAPSYVSNVVRNLLGAIGVPAVSTTVVSIGA